MSGHLDSHCVKLDIATLRRAGALDLEPWETKEGCFLMDPGDPMGGSISWGTVADEQGRLEGVALVHRAPGGASVEQPVWLTTTPCNFGGSRFWFQCPVEGCGRRVRVLYLTPGATQFVCRHCAGIIYSVTRETRSQRLARREAKVQERLGGADSSGGPRPKGMHKTTYTRLAMLQTALSIDRHEAVLDKLLRQEGLGDLVD